MERTIRNHADEYMFQAFSFIKVLNFFLALVSGIAIVSLILQYGFFLPQNLNLLLIRIDLFIVQFYLFQFVLKAMLSRDKMYFLRHRWFESLLALMILLEVLLLFKNVGFDVLRNFVSGIDVTAIIKFYIGIAQILIVASIIAEGIRYNTKIGSLKFHPSQTLLLSFLLLIFAGSGLLMLPRAVTPGNFITFVDALFTATSAVCVTGLSVVDTGSYFSHLGQLIILVLVQVGGIGIMTLSCFLAIFFGQGVGIREGVVVNQMINVEKISLISTTIRNVVVLTFSIEIAGAILLMYLWADNGWSINYLFFVSLFHSVCAFCNAGFSTFPDSLVRFQNNIPVISVISILIILGGIGFTVITECSTLFLKSKKKRRIVLKVQTRLVLIVTAILLVGGFIFLYIFDTSEDGTVRIISSFFNSVTSRTAGFSSIDMRTLSVPSVLILMGLMFIGASPGSTGGGIKTTTIAVLWSSIHAIITGKNRVIIFRRRLPFLILNRALVIFVFSVAVIAVAVFLLSITENASVLELAFEAISAYGTVGLSLGITGALTLSGKLTIIFLMFIGRIGALTLVFAITSPTEQPAVKIEYPTESVTIG